jgi:hypothetical protein
MFLVVKDGALMIDEAGTSLLVSETDPAEGDCCCPDPTPLVCCPEAADRSVWCDVSDSCLATGPVEFVYKGSVSRPDGSGFANIFAQEWEGSFCEDGTGKAYLRCGGGYLGQSVTLWRLRLERSTPSGTMVQMFGIDPDKGQCTPFAIQFTGNIFTNTGILFCDGCPYGPCTFSFML